MLSWQINYQFVFLVYNYGDWPIIRRAKKDVYDRNIYFRSPEKKRPEVSESSEEATPSESEPESDMLV
jgi:hypothetical protein